MSTTNRRVAKWAATAEVEPRQGNSLLGAASGAYVAVVGLAQSESEFRSALRRAIEALDFELVDVDDLRQFNSTKDLAGFDAALRERVSTLHKGNPIEFGAFHSFSD